MIFIKNMLEADKYNALAKKRNNLAFEKSVKTDIKVQNQKIKTINAIEKLENRKKGIMETSMSDFLDVLKQIKKIEFHEDDEIYKMLENWSSQVQTFSIKTQLNLKTKELNTAKTLGALLFKGGISGIIAKEAQINARLASMRNKQADVIVTQGETICVALENIEKEANTISAKLAELNVKLIQFIAATSRIINQKGIQKEKYTSKDIEIFMNCFNAADAVKKFIDTPLLDEEGKLTQESIRVIQEGNLFLEELKSKVEGIC